MGYAQGLHQPLLLKPAPASAPLLPDVQDMGTSRTSCTNGPCHPAEPAVSIPDEAGLQQTEASGNPESTARRAWVGIDVVVRGGSNPQGGLATLEEKPHETGGACPAKFDITNGSCLEELHCPPPWLRQVLPAGQSSGNPVGGVLGTERKGLAHRGGRDKGVQTRAWARTQELGPVAGGQRADRSSNTLTRASKSINGLRSEKRAGGGECSTETHHGRDQTMDVESHSPRNVDGPPIAPEVMSWPYKTGWNNQTWVCNDIT
jgi:hypothetical protein